MNVSLQLAIDAIRQEERIRIAERVRAYVDQIEQIPPSPEVSINDIVAEYLDDVADLIEKDEI